MKLRKETFDLKSKVVEIYSKYGTPTPTVDQILTEVYDDYFKLMNISRRIETDDGRKYTVDVQSDFRFPFVHFTHTTQRNYPLYDIKPCILLLHLINKCSITQHF